jgi:predicted ABC-type sugar transport system permease subunit
VLNAMGSWMMTHRLGTLLVGAVIGVVLDAVAGAIIGWGTDLTVAGFVTSAVTGALILSAARYGLMQREPRDDHAV